MASAPTATPEPWRRSRRKVQPVPNPRLQRTRSASPPSPPSPLSRQPLGRLIIVVSLFLLGLSPQKRSELTPAELGVRETVFRYGIEKCPWGNGGEGTVCFLRAENGEDPSAELIARFTKPKFPIKPVSVSYVDSRFRRLDRVTGESGSVYWISDIRILSSSRVDALGGYCSIHSLFQLQRAKGKWRVVGEIEKGVS